jgi:hypothetical protein
MDEKGAGDAGVRRKAYGAWRRAIFLIALCLLPWAMCL